MDEKVRKHSMGVFGVFGAEPNFEIKGVMMWRGSGIIKPME